ncbi:hypothetical protein CJ739_1020 [Mariniflexile rhizosphaerae]|nr:hypothetical protein CJ739_1020 [Mariniflexile sp. TRM1-10]
MLQGLPRIFDVLSINASWACPEIVDYQSKSKKSMQSITQIYLKKTFHLNKSC